MDEQDLAEFIPARSSSRLQALVGANPGIRVCPPESNNSIRCLQYMIYTLKDLSKFRILMDETETNFGFLVHDVARQLTAVLDKRLSNYGLTRSHWRAVIYIWRTPGISQTELSEILDLSRMGVTGLIDRMESKGLVSRRDDAKDRRVKRIYLTESTTALVPLITKLGRECIDEFLAGIDETDREVLVNLLLKVKSNGTRLLSTADLDEQPAKKQELK